VCFGNNKINDEKKEALATKSTAEKRSYYLRVHAA